MSKAESLASCPDESHMHGAQVEEAAGAMATGESGTEWMEVGPENVSQIGGLSLPHLSNRGGGEFRIRKQKSAE